MLNAELIFSYFPNLNQEQKNQFIQSSFLYKEWNEKINVISRKDIDALYLHHILHSLGIAKVMPFADHTSVLDVGTGGGFPGIPLAILFPNCQFHLVDSIGKKITVVKEIASALNLKNVTAQQIRAEQLENKYDFVVSRAVTDLSEFCLWIRKKITTNNFNTLHNGLLYLKGGDLSNELKPFGKNTQVYHLNQYFKEDFFETKKVVYLPSGKIK
ncbi:MAG: 16S rRNA (guanine(527)-N(7))-methyltransferase RsmG [Bacteroidetes bacterium]|nr:16S rRNA (guanine(527)-N(7))-methyltransferase RsmG [Bacteroidota bacterium]